MRKGIVMESGDKWTVILTAQGEFVKIPAHPQHIEGKEVFFHPEAVVLQEKKKRRWPRWMSGVSLATACLLLLAVLFPLGGGSSAYAAVTIDINPSVELQVNKDGMVMEITSMDEEGQDVIKELNWKDQPLATVTISIIQLAKQKGYMNTEQRVLITTTYYEEEHERSLDPFLEEASQTVNPDQEITFVILEGKKEWHDEAKAKQVPPGAYMLVKKAEQQGITIKQEEANEVKLEQILPVTGVKVIAPKSKKDKPKEIKGNPSAPGQQKKQEHVPSQAPNKGEEKKQDKKPEEKKSEEKKESQSKEKPKEEKEAPKKVPPKPHEDQAKPPAQSEKKDDDDRDGPKGQERGKGNENSQANHQEDKKEDKKEKEENKGNQKEKKDD